MVGIFSFCFISIEYSTIVNIGAEGLYFISVIVFFINFLSRKLNFTYTCTIANEIFHKKYTILSLFKLLLPLKGVYLSYCTSFLAETELYGLQSREKLGKLFGKI